MIEKMLADMNSPDLETVEPMNFEEHMRYTLHGLIAEDWQCMVMKEAMHS